MRPAWLSVSAIPVLRRPPARLLLREVETLGFRAAQRAAGRPGRMFHVEQISVWTDGEEGFDKVLAEATAAAGHFASVTGLAAGLGRPLRVLCFAREAAFVACTRGPPVRIGRAVGHCFGLFRKRVVLCREMADRVASDLRDMAAHEITHHLTHSCLRRQPWPWLAGLPEHVVAKHIELAYDRGEPRQETHAAADSAPAFSGAGDLPTGAKAPQKESNVVKKVGCVIGLVGLLMLVGGVALIGATISSALEANRVAEVDMELGKAAATELLTVNTDRACQVAIQIAVESQSVGREKVGAEEKLKLQYKFPLSYKVTDADGKVVHSQDTAIAYNQGVKENSSWTVTPDGGSGRARCNFAKFDVAAPGQIRVEATMGPDTDYNAQATALKLQVYDNVSRHGASVGGGVVLLLIGPLVGVLGIVIFIVGLARGKKAPAAPQSYDPGPPVEYEIKD